MARTIFPLDELNAFREFVLPLHFDERGRIKSRKDCEDIIDELLDLFLLAYANGVEKVNKQFGEDIQPSPTDIEKTVYLPIDGKTWVDRVWEWFDSGGNADDIMRIAETEAHRDGNAAADDTAVKAGAVEKTWTTMLDDKVRDTHLYLQSVTVPVDGRFYTYDNDSARFPGDFTLAENNCNCRCEVEYR